MSRKGDIGERISSKYSFPRWKRKGGHIRKDETIYVVLCDLLVRRSGDVRVLRVFI